MQLTGTWSYLLRIWSHDQPVNTIHISQFDTFLKAVKMSCKVHTDLTLTLTWRQKYKQSLNGIFFYLNAVAYVFYDNGVNYVYA